MERSLFMIRNKMQQIVRRNSLPGKHTRVKPYSGFSKGRLLLGFLFFAVCFFTSCHSNKSGVQVNGQVAGFAHQKIELYQLQAENFALLNSVNAGNDGRFSFSFEPEESGFYILQSPDQKRITLVVEKGESITIREEKTPSGNTISIHGSPGSETYRTFENHLQKGLQTIDSLRVVLMNSRDRKEFSEIRLTLDSLFNQLYLEQQQMATKTIKSDFSSLANLLIVNKNFTNRPLFTIQRNFDFFAQIDSALHLKYPQNSLVIDFHNKIESYREKNRETLAKARQLQPGTTAPDLELPNAAGLPVKLSSLRGKTVLLYFWAAWNPPSREGNLNLTNIYNQFKTNNFEIYAVSLDEDASLWKSAIKKDKAYWIQVCDLKSVNSQAAIVYGVQNLPQTFLIDKTGVLQAKNPSLEALKAFLQKNK